MVEILKEDSNYKYKGFTFDDDNNNITYGYYFVKSSNILKKITKLTAILLKSSKNIKQIILINLKNI